MEQIVLVNGRPVGGLAGSPGGAGGADGVWLRDGSVAALGDADDLLAEARRAGPVAVVDLAGAHVLPGLIDMHTHFGVVHPGTGDVARLRGESEAALALRLAACARDALAAGVTTVRLVGERRGADFALRAAVERGEIAGPRIFTAGRSLRVTGGHGHGSGGLEGDGPDQFRRHVREQIRQGADHVKLMISGGISDEGEGTDSLQMSEPELRAAVETAHAWGRPVAGHLGGADVIDLALDCGIDTVEHGYVVTAPVAGKMAALGAWLVPTMTVTRSREFFAAIGAPGWLADRLEAAAPRHAESVEVAAANGVRVLAGTDFLPSAVFAETSAMVRELELLAAAGLGARGALEAATVAAADCLGQPRLGRLAPGAHADVIAVEGDPAADVSALRDLRLVIARGTIVRRGRDVTVEEIRDAA